MIVVEHRDHDSKESTDFWHAIARISGIERAVYRIGPDDELLPQHNGQVDDIGGRNLICQKIPQSLHRVREHLSTRAIG